MKTLKTLIALAGLGGLFFANAEIALAKIDDGGYRPSRNEILTQCEQIHNNNAQLDKCLSAAATARN